MTFHMASKDYDHDALEVDGCFVFVYVKDGMLQVSVDLDDAGAHLRHGPEELVPLHIAVQGSTVYHADPRNDPGLADDLRLIRKYDPT